MKQEVEYRGIIYKCELDVSEEELKNIYVRDLVLDWCSKKHPEVFQKAQNAIDSLMKEKESGLFINTQA